jgi:hypoxanthine phosphoribosyltransferase
MCVDADILSWDDISSACTLIAEEVTDGSPPDVVVGIARGGLVPAVMIAHLLGLRDLRHVCLTRTAGDQINAPKRPIATACGPDSLGDLHGRSVLIIDDVAGSGETIEAATRLVGSLRPTRIRTAVCVVNDGNWRGSHLPDHVAIRSHRWVVFPWECI